VAVEGNNGSRGSPVAVAARLVLEVSSAGSGNGRRRLPMARPSRWGGGEGESGRRCRAISLTLARHRLEDGARVDGDSGNRGCSRMASAAPSGGLQRVAAMRGGEAEVAASRRRTTARRGNQLRFG
jgi:hypothetical protein